MVRRDSKILKAFLALSCSVYIYGCGKTYDGSLTAPYAAYVVALTGLDSEGVPKFELAKKTFKYLDNFDELSGPYLEMRRGGALEIKEVRGSIVSADKFSGGSSPNLRYVVENNTAIARDYASLAQISAFYQFDIIFDRFESVLGFPLNNFEAGLKSKLRAFFEPELTIKIKDSSASASIKFNAAYMVGQHQFLLFQRSAVEGVPLSSNLQVLSHEFGHALFEYAFFANNIQSDPGRFEKEYSISGLNEGFSDFISYLYTGSADILRASLDIEKYAKDRHFLKTTFRYSDLHPFSNLDGENCGASFYCIGTLFVRSLVKAKEALPAINNATYAASIIDALSKAKKLMEAYDTGILPKDRSDEFEDDSELTLQHYAYNGKVVGAFLRALLESLDSSTRSALCPQLIKDFGNEAFPEAARTEVCSE